MISAVIVLAGIALAVIVFGVACEIGDAIGNERSTGEQT